MLLSGNPICKNSSFAFQKLCAEQCSDYCIDSIDLGDGWCDIRCNVKKCEFDNGDC